ncbi:sensor histidine kinase [Corynebacterium sp. TAE3-ERU12]|nr:histidine kinase [Corynebacterium sp. TAE3-ERU12]MBV7295909.1 sensor histidine kinase [Corynebacterium sp. TAE3-ERU12]
MLSWGQRRAQRTESVEAYEAEIARLIDSRRAIVAAYEVERRRIERDLHDGAQQYLVAASVQLGEARLEAPADHRELLGLLDQAHCSIECALTALRRTVRGIHPQLLSEAGLVAALEDAVTHSTSDVTLTCPNEIPHLPEGVAACAYFLVMECLTNAAKHAPEASISVLVTVSEDLRISIVDTGPGGARVIPGGGLAGMRERLAAFGGTLDVSSPAGGPTQIIARVPLLLYRGESSVVLPSSHTPAPGEK